VLGGLSEDVWSYDLVEQRFAIAEPAPDADDGSPPARRGAGVFAGHPIGRPVFFAGETGTGDAAPAEAWSIETPSLDAWTRFHWTSGAPAARTGAMTWEAGPCARLLVAGGVAAGSSTVLSDYWKLTSCSTDGTGCAWTEAPATVAMPTHPAFATTTRIDSDIFVFGGFDGSSSTNAVFRADTCSSTGFTSFTEVTVAPDTTASPPTPPARMGHTASSTIGADRLIVFGGTNAFPSSERYGDAWLLTRSTGGWEWQRVEPLASAPSPLPRAYHLAAWDRTNGQLLVFGGSARDGTNRYVLNDLWALILAD